MKWKFLEKKKNDAEALVKGVKIGIVFAGGGARGFGLIGAIKAFEEFGIKPDFICGTSVGSLIGAGWASGRTAEELVTLAKSLREKDIRTSKLFFMPSKTNGLEEVVQSILDGDKLFSELKIPFAAVATELNTASEKVFETGKVARCVAASCAAPGVFVPVEMNGKNYVDGGLMNNLPASVAKAKGCDVVIGVDVNASREEGTDSVKVLDVVGIALKILMNVNVQLGYQHADFVIRPDLKKFKATRFDGSQDMIEEGYRAAKAMMPKIFSLLKDKKAIKILRKKKKKTDRFHKKFINQSRIHKEG